VVEALRAAVALPFMFAAVKIDGKRLIDGFVADPLPVSAASDAHSVLALGFASPMPHRVDRPTRMLAQITSAMTNNLVEARLAAATSKGQRLITLMPALERRVGLFDTEAMPYLVDAGRRATEARLPEIFALLTQRPQLAVA
jgi:NTE family protein